MTEQAGSMILRTSLTSPFGRKVRMAAAILGLADWITIEPADTSDPADSLMAQNPLGKIPCLVLANGQSIYDSGVIVEYLQEVAGVEILIPRSGPSRIDLLVAARLADGIIDAGALIIYEARYHPQEALSPRWLDHQRTKILRALDSFERALPAVSPVDVASLGLSCALGFLDKRKPVEWRPHHPELVRWLDDFADAEPAFGRTRPPEQ